MTHHPSLSVIIPARNEERLIERCIRSILVSSRSAEIVPEIIVVLNRCTDETERIATALGASTVVDDAKNLSHIRNTGIRASSGEIIVTIDADSQMSPGMIPEILATMNDTRWIGGGVAMLPERWSLGIIVTGLLLVPVALWHGISGGVFYLRREDFNAIGGFDESRASAEDIDFASRLRRYGLSKGKRFKTIFRAWIVTSCRKFDHFGDWYFVRQPLLFIKLLRGRDQRFADKIWYDFRR